MRRAAWKTFLLLPLAGCGGDGPTAVTPPNPTPAATPTPVAGPTPTPTPTPGPVVLRSASIRGVNGHSASGTARIVRTGSDHTLELRNDFRIDMGSVDLYLTRNAGGFDGSDLRVAPLRAISGAQSYGLPHDGAQYRYVLLWCRPFQIPIGLGELR
jgi:hypothetical protein